MTRARTLAFALAVVAMLGAPLLQHSAEAQERGGGRGAPAPRPGSRTAAGPRRGTRVVMPRRGSVVIGAYYRPLYYSSFYSPFYDRFYDPWFPSGYGGYAGYGAGQFYGPEPALRLQVSRRATEVFVDGYYVGTVDDFDGIFQRLRLAPGEYELTLYLPGYQTVTQQLLLQPDRTLRLKHVMVPLAPTGPAAAAAPILTSRSARSRSACNRPTPMC